LTQKEELVACLQQELVKVRLREAENEALIRDLKDHIMELEEVLFDEIFTSQLNQTDFRTRRLYVRPRLITRWHIYKKN
jgi:hypothetical protein